MYILHAIEPNAEMFFDLDSGMLYLTDGKKVEVRMTGSVVVESFTGKFADTLVMHLLKNQRESVIIEERK